MGYAQGIYEEPTIALFTTYNTRSSSGGKLTGEETKTYQWTLSWDDTNGFTGITWTIGYHTYTLEQINTAYFKEYDAPTVAKYLVDNKIACATYSSIS